MVAADVETDPEIAADMADTSVVVLHTGQHYAVRHLRCNSTPAAAVCFDYWKPQTGLMGEFSAERFLRRHRINAVGILAAENDWFQNDEIETVIAVIKQAMQGHELIGYGSSMGAYAAINFADLLGLRRVIAICPQYSIDPARAPYETRWPREAARIAAGGGFRRDRIGQVRPPVSGWLVYDPAGTDLHHAAGIQRHHALTELHIPFAQHNEMRLLQQCELSSPMVLDMIADTFDKAAFTRKLRAARRRSAIFWVGMSAALTATKRLPAALHAIRQARRQHDPEPAQIDLQEAAVWAAMGNHGNAARLARRWAADPNWSWAAAPLIAAAPQGFWRRIRRLF